MRIVFTFIFTLIITVLAYSQAPQAFNYQGVARDLSGTPLPNQNISLQISILQDTTIGVDIYKETHSTITNQLGLFNIQIGNGTVMNGLFEDIPWNESDHFIQIGIDENGGGNYTLIGTSQLFSVPYALNAANGSKWEESSTGLKYEDGTVSVGPSLGNGLFEINGSSNLPIVDDFETLLSTTISDASEDYFAIQNGTPADNQFIPIIRGHHESTPRVSLFILGSTSTANDIFLIDKPLVEFNARITNQSNGTFVQNRLLYGWKNYTDFKMVLDADGNLGVGTNTPNAKIQVADGDIYIEDINKGVIMKSPNGQCWRMTVNNSGELESAPITCPN